MPVMNTMLAVRPSEDQGMGVNRYGFYWVVPILRQAQRNGLTVIDLNAEQAIAETFFPHLNYYDPLFVFGFGHGNETSYTGQNLDEILHACQNDETLAGRVVYLLSCHTATILGQSMVNKGVLTYIGYDEDFQFVWFANHNYINPLIDSFARGFFESALEIPRSLINGSTTGQAYNNSIAMWNKWIDYWSRQNTPEAPFILEVLLWDRDNQVLFGSTTEKIAIIQKREIAFASPQVIAAGIGIALLL